MSFVSDSVPVDCKRFGIEPTDSLAILGMRVLTLMAPGFMARLTSDHLLGYSPDDVKNYLENRRCSVCDSKKGAQGLDTIFVGDKAAGAKIAFVCREEGSTCRSAAIFNSGSSLADEQAGKFNRAAMAAWNDSYMVCDMLRAHLAAESKELAPFEQLMMLSGVADSGVWQGDAIVKNDEGRTVDARVACRYFIQAARRGRSFKVVKV